MSPCYYRGFHGCHNFITVFTGIDFSYFGSKKIGLNVGIDKQTAVIRKTPFIEKWSIWAVFPKIKKHFAPVF